jgi:hypothetical protein
MGENLKSTQPPMMRLEVRIVNADISGKFAAFAAALTMNGLILAGLAYVFNAPLERHIAGIADSGLRRQCGCTPREPHGCRCVATSRL